MGRALCIIGGLLAVVGGFWLRDEWPEWSPGALFLIPAGGVIAAYGCWRYRRSR